MRAADDCFQLGKVAYNNEDFYHAIKWFTEALRIDDEETNKTTTRHVVLDYLSYSVFVVSNNAHSTNVLLLLKAKFHYASWFQWFEAGSKLVADPQRAGIWHII